MNVETLIDRGMTPEIIDKWKQSGNLSLLPIQLEAVQKGVLDQQSLLIVAPTSSGKTFIGEMAAIAHALQGKRSLYLVPYKAIAEEKYLDFYEKYGVPEIGFAIRVSDRDHRDTDDEIGIGNYDIAILTYEKLASLLTMNPGILDCCDCIIVDEVQMVMDPERGGTLELLLTKIKAAQGTKQIVALSAVLGNLNEFDKWLNAEVVYSKARPIELHQGVLLPDGSFHWIGWNSGQRGTENFNSGILERMVEELLAREEQVVVIRNTVSEAQSTATMFSRMFTNLPAAHKTIQILNAEPESETRDFLLNTLRHSIAFHHADCELGERRAVEEGFRNGDIKVISATTTLSMGVNLPCKTVILADNFKWSFVRGGFQQVNWLVGEVRNILGRAGRLGQTEDYGRGILLANNTTGIRQIQRAYLEAPLEPFRSTFEHKDIALRVLDVIATGFSHTEQEVLDFIFTTYAARQWKTDDAKKQITDHVRNGMRKCLESGLCEMESSSRVIANELGKICASKGSSIESFVELKHAVENFSGFNIVDAAFVGSIVHEVRSGFYRGVRWYDALRHERVLNRINELVDSGEGGVLVERALIALGGRMGERDAPQFAITALAHDILKTNISTKDIREAYILSTSNIRNICQNLSWMLDIMASIAGVLNLDITEKLQNMSDCLNYRVPLSCRFLNRIEVFLSREEKTRLVGAGINSLDDFIGKKGSDFKGIINPGKADRIIQRIHQRRVKNHQYWEKEHMRRLDAKNISTRSLEPLYSQTGINLERAICELFESDFADCSVIRISDQNKGEPDLIMTFPDGHKMTIQVTAKDDTTKFIDSKKAGDIIPQSARFYPDAYMCLGRPDFQELAKEQSTHLASTMNYKLMPIYILAELYVRQCENKLSPSDIATFFYNVRGYVRIRDIEEIGTPKNQRDSQ